MDIKNYTAEDFVLDPEFKKWVLSPTPESNLMWDKLLETHPSKVKEVKLAREILMNLSYENHRLSESESLILWRNIERKILETINTAPAEKVVPLNSGAILKKHEANREETFTFSQFYRVVAILIVVFALGIITNLFYTPSLIEEPPHLVFEEHSTLPGVKSTLTLNDGSKVILNSGSTLRYAKSFEPDQRVLYLEGEAYFEVAKDPTRPFSVITGEVVTTALGTAFNIRAYEHEDLNIFLVSGKVAVEVELETPVSLILEKGEGVLVNIQEGKAVKGSFETDQVIGWTQKKIHFEKIKLDEAVRILENWYGVTFNFQNQPNPGLLLSGKFHDETLENVLEGLSYSARFEYLIKEDAVDIKFK